MDFFKCEVNSVEITNIITLGFACISVICLYGRYRSQHPEYHDPLMIKLGLYDLDGWSITHFGFNLFYGYYYPSHWWCAFLCGCLWEGFEHFYGETRPGFLGGFGDFKSTDPNVNNWWYGRISDPIINLVGLVTGMHLARYNI